MTKPRIHIAPFSFEDAEKAVRTAGGELSGAEDADAIIWGNPADPQGLKELLGSSNPRWVQLPFAGIESFFEAGVIDEDRIWTCAKGTYGHATAEHALALTLAAARRLPGHARAKEWGAFAGVGSGFGSPERMLKDSTVVILGTGGIGRALTGMLGPLEPRVIGVNRSGRPLEGAAETVAIDHLDDVVGAGDFVVLALSLTPETRHVIDARRLELMKDSAWLVNVARGGHVDTDALVKALREETIGGAALDVTDPEPLPAGHPLWDLPNALITPHVANTWDMALPALVAQVERNVARFAAGRELEGLVDPGAGY